METPKMSEAEKLNYEDYRRARLLEQENGFSKELTILKDGSLKKPKSLTPQNIPLIRGIFLAYSLLWKDLV